MRKPAYTIPASKIDSLVCPLCESSGLQYDDQSVARCTGCNRTLGGAMLEPLKQIVALPDIVGSHPCECGHPEMRRLPDGVLSARLAVLRFYPSRPPGPFPDGVMGAKCTCAAGRTASSVVSVKAM
jgi:ribosomal protein L37AE/L43A